MRKRFNYAEFVAGWRAIAADHGLDPVTGCYTYADDPGWWKRDVTMWTDAGISHSCVERDAIASIAQQARAAHGLAEPRTLEQAMDAEFRQIVREVLREEMPLAELHRRRGVTVETIEGVRLEIPIKGAA